MEVILLQDVKKLGKKGETVTVSDGYANNFLIRQNLAVKKTSGSINVLNKQHEDQARNEEKLRNDALATKEQLETITLEYKVKPQKDGTMSKSISTKEIENTLKEKGIIIDKRKIIDKYPINAFGYTRLKIELYKDVVGTINIHCSEEGK